MIDIRLAREGDKGQVLARLEEVYGVEPARRAEHLWDWQWHRDPRLATPGYRGVVAEWRGHIIGNLATIPAGLEIHGEPATAWWFVDVLVHWGLTRRALRGHKRGGGGPDLSRGLAAALFDHPAAGPIQLGKHIADAMAAIGARIGFQTLDGTGSLHRRVSIRYPLGKVLGTRLGDWVGAGVDRFVGPCPRPHPPVRVHLGRFDTRFDALWQSVKSAYPAICRRDADLLNWRYRDHPDEDHWVLTLGDGERLRGYCVIRVFNRGPRRRGKLLDLLTAPDDLAARQALLAAALRELRRLRAERVECFCTDVTLERLLRAVGFSTKTSGSKRPRPMMVRNLPAAAAGIYVTQGDGDGG